MRFRCLFAVVAVLPLVGCEDMFVSKLCRDDTYGTYNCWSGECFSDETEIESFGPFEDCEAAIPPDDAPGGSVGGDCTVACTREFPGDVQLDSFCQAACCYAINGQSSYAEQTCQAGSALGTDACRYCP